MSFEQFQTEILIDLKKKNKNCIKNIEKNKELIENNIGPNGNVKTIDKFVYELNNFILQVNKNFSLVEKVLKHPLMAQVYESFKNSQILIEACKAEKKNCLKWLINMDINPCVQDKVGMTALMYAAQKSILNFVVQYLCTKESCLNLVDMNGENAVYHALDNNVALKELMKTNIDVNLVNYEKETVLVHCVKNSYYYAVSILCSNPRVDVNAVDAEGNSVAMILAENARDEEFRHLPILTTNFDYRSPSGECVLTIVIRKLYNESNNCFAQYIRILSYLVHSNCNFNLPVDDAGNSALMVFMLVKDMYTSYYVSKYSRSIDLSVKNSFGENPSTLCLKMSNRKLLFDVFKTNPTFDIEYVDPNTKNTFLMLSSMVEPNIVLNIVENDINLVNEVNNRNETALILATKCKQHKAAEILIKNNAFVNHQDYLGNTALYYAVELRDLKMIKILIDGKADINITNNGNMSPIKLAHEFGIKSILGVLNDPVSYYKYADLKGKGNIDDEIPEVNPQEKYPETFEYLYTYSTNAYPQFEMSYPLECLERSVYTGEVKKISNNNDQLPGFDSHYNLPYNPNPSDTLDPKFKFFMY